MPNQNQGNQPDRDQDRNKPGQGQQGDRKSGNPGQRTQPGRGTGGGQQTSTTADRDQ